MHLLFFIIFNFFRLKTFHFCHFFFNFKPRNIINKININIFVFLLFVTVYTDRVDKDVMSI